MRQAGQVSPTPLVIYAVVERQVVRALSDPDLVARAIGAAALLLALVPHLLDKNAERVPVLGLALTESFYDPKPPWVISSRGPVRGLHAVVGAGVGRHHGDRVFLIRNSWGVEWGDRGYAWLDEAFLAQNLKEALLLTHEVVS